MCPLLVRARHVAKPLPLLSPLSYHQHQYPNIVSHISLATSVSPSSSHSSLHSSPSSSPPFPDNIIAIDSSTQSIDRLRLLSACLLPPLHSLLVIVVVIKWVRSFHMDSYSLGRLSTAPPPSFFVSIHFRVISLVSSSSSSFRACMRTCSLS